MFIDTHAHLQDDLMPRIDEVLKNAENNNVKKIICASYNLKSSLDAVLISTKYEQVFATVGVHPENCDEYNDEIETKLAQLCKNKKVIAIGEIGLDYHYTKENKEKQKSVFIKQILLAYKLKLPVVIHTRDAIGDTIEIVEKYKNYFVKGGIFHCFHESKEILERILKLGFFVSYGGAITFNNAQSLRAIVSATPVDRILTETDCPYMSPVPLRGQENEPKNIPIIAQKISELKNIEINKLEKILEENTKKIYNI